jgi:hypothetical protein
MAPPKGNQYWKLCTSHGAKCKIDDAGELLERATEYFHWCDKHPWKKEKTIKKANGTKEVETTPYVRPYTIAGLCGYLRICKDTWYILKPRAIENNDNAMFDVVTRIENVIEAQRMEGGLNDGLNSNFAARLLGLTDKTEVTNNDVSSMLGGKLEIVIHDTGTKLRSSEEDIDD